MTDPFSLTTGLVSIVGFTGQVAQGVDFLYGVFKDVKNSSEFMEDFHANLGLLRSTLSRLESNELRIPPGQECHVRKAYEQCARKVASLEELLKKHMPKATDGKVKKWRKKLLAGLKTKDIVEHAAGIERSKTSLELALHISHIEETREFYIMHRETSEKISTKVEDISSELRAGVRDIQNCWRNSDVTALIQAEVQKCINQASLASSARPSSCSETKADSEDELEEQFEDASEYFEMDIDLNKYSTEKDYPASRRVTRSIREFYIGFGIIQQKSTTTTELEPEDQSSMIMTCHTSYAFLPAAWLSPRGIQAVFESTTVFGGSIIRHAALRPVPRIPDNSAIIKAVRRGHLVNVIGLFKSGRASPHDIDTSGKSLLEHAIVPDIGRDRIAPVTLGTVVLVRYLIRCGAESSTAMPAIHIQQRTLRQQEVLLNGDLKNRMTGDKIQELNDAADSWKNLEELGRMCLNHAKEDPFQDPTLRLDMWSSSEVGRASKPLDSFYLYHDKWPIGVEDIAIEQPKVVFNILLTVDAPSSSDYHELVKRLNCRYNILNALYRDGAMKEICSRVNSDTPYSTSDAMQNSLFCLNAPNHLLHRVFSVSNMGRCQSRFRGIIRQHIQRLLVLFLRNGEDPHLRCPCSAMWNGRQGETRTPTDLAIARNLLDTWNDALSEVGLDPEDFLHDRVVTEPVEECLGKWNQTIDLSPEVQRKVLLGLGAFH
ncbi:hypothetical protein K432DRAFT_424433 [Lepidopterella palustris CBS 459.81]|uniref:Fungal N-terminal domain-containing protein n=1 Tax=Lepidopterella palustris CBS 459.81 TaxID=1314670 RepID=A0A8E2EDZ5_9PEZI|nr:hypothetical protein K432DRAFT_424433 [Lepidopterella palustris CBS 459.81]